MRLDVRLLGSTRVHVDGRPWRLAVPPRALPLLAFLALRRDLVRRSVVAQALWPDEPDAEARANLRRHLHALRRALPPSDVPWILDDGAHLAWNAEAPAQIDAAAFDRLVAAPETRAEAVALYGGDLLPGCEDEWLTIERERMRGLFLDALVECAAQARRERDFAAAAGYAERLLAHDDLREDALRELIAARYEAGDRGAALTAYERFASRLRDELDVAPMPETMVLADAIRARAPLPDDEPADVAAPPDRWQPAFAGRETELATLRRAWARAARGNGSTIFVGGEAGIGKSRLVAELAATARRQGGRVALGTTSDPEGEPYQALLVALRRVLGFGGGEDADPAMLATLARVLPEVHALRADLPPSDGLDGEPARERLFDALARFVERIARVRPLLLVLEDLHWCGAATLDALGALARRAGSLPVLIVATYRSGEIGPDHPLRAARTRLAAEQRGTTLALRRLGAADVSRMLACAEFVDAPATLGAALHRISDGNPLFVGQLARAYIETGVVPGDDAPRAIGDAIAVRVARLDPRVRAVGEVAAALGDTFGVDTVVEVGGWDEAFVLDALGDLIDAAMVREAGGTEYAYAFTHALVAGALYDATPRAQRMARHRRIARVLERRASGERTALETIARHWRLAGDAARASGAYLGAARAALAVFARSEAIGFAHAAVELAADDAGRFAALQVAASARVRSSGDDAWDADLAQLEDVATRLGDAQLFEALALREMQLYQLGRRDEETAVIARMIALADAAANDAWRATAYDARGMLLLASGDLPEAAAALRRALEAGERAVADASEAGERHVADGLAGRARLHLAQVVLRLGDAEGADTLLRLQPPGGTFDEQRALALASAAVAFAREDDVAIETAGQELLALARFAADSDSEGKAHALLALAAHLRADPVMTRQQYDAGLAIFQRAGNSTNAAIMLVNRATFELEIGNVDEGLRLFARGLALAEQVASRLAIGNALVGRADAYLMRGDLDAALESARAAHDLAESSGERRLTGATLITLGAVHAARGDRDAALAAMRAGVDERRAANAVRSLIDDLAQLLELLVDAGDAAAARACADELRSLDAPRTHRRCHPMRIARALAREAFVRGDVEAAAAALSEGRALLAERVAALGADGATYAALPFNQVPLEDAAAARR